MEKVIQYPPFLKPVYETFQAIVNGDYDKVQRYFYIMTARGTGKTTTVVKLNGYFWWDFPVVINVCKKTWTKILEFADQIKQVMENDYGKKVYMNQSKRRMEFGKSVIRFFTLNKEHMKQKEVPTGISIEYTKKAVINIVDECSPDIDYGLWSVFEQSQKSGDDKIPKVTLFMSNPWVRGDWFISKWFKNVQWTRHDGMTPPFYKIVNVGKTTFIGASLFANPMCPETDIQTYWDTTEYNKNQRNIVVFGLPGASNGQVFDNFYKMQFHHIPEDKLFTGYFCGIDIGWTTVAGEGGATTMEVFKYHYEQGLEGVLEYYHHNKDGFADSTSQQRWMLTKLKSYLNSQHDDKPCFVFIDGGADGMIGQHFAQDWAQNYAPVCTHRVFFQTVTAGMKTTWKLKDRYDWINTCLAMNKILISDGIQPHLAMDLEGAVYKDTTVNIEKDPVMVHDFSDTIMALCYASIGYYSNWLAGWKLYERKLKKLSKMSPPIDNTNSTSPTIA